jgi:hypothetical protein
MATSTLKSTGGDYVSIVAWEADKQGNLTEPEILECYKGTTVNGGWQADGSLNEMGVNIDGWVASATNRIIIRAASGEEHKGVQGAGFRIAGTPANFGNVLIVSTAFAELADLELQNLRTSNGSCVQVQNTGADPLYIMRCIFASESGACIAGIAEGIVQNCLLLGGVSTSSGLSVSSFSGAVIDNCTAIGPLASGFRSASSVASVTYKNCVAQGCDTDFDDRGQGWGAQTTNNASGDGTAPGADSVTGVVEGDFVDYAGGDYTPATSGKLDGTGADLSGSFTDDIAGNTRSVPWEIGAYEIAGAAPGVTFDGPDIIAQTATEGVQYTFQDNGEGTVASRFTGATSYAYAPGSDQPAGITINATTGNPEGTPSVSGTFDITIEGSD